MSGSSKIFLTNSLFENNQALSGTCINVNYLSFQKKNYHFDS